MRAFIGSGTCRICARPKVNLYTENICYECDLMIEESNEIALDLYFSGQRYLYEIVDWRPDDASLVETEEGLKELAP